MVTAPFDRKENILGKGENAGYQHFSFSHNVFKRLISQGHSSTEKFGKGISRY